MRFEHLLIIVGIIAVVCFLLARAVTKAAKRGSKGAKMLQRFTTLGTHHKTSIIKCRSCQWTGTLDRWSESNGCPKCGSDVYEKTGDETLRRNE